MKRCYFDNASTTPTDPEVIKAMEPYYFEQFGNPSSPHSIGREAQTAMENARQTVADFIGAQSNEIVFTSGATESNNHAILGIAQAIEKDNPHVIVSSIEHHSVLEPIQYLQHAGFSVTYIPVDENGLVDPQDVKMSIKDETVLIAVMHASNEIGTVQSLDEIGAIATLNDIPFLVDACQTVGHIPVKVNDLQCDLMSFSAHKFYGPKGVGALYIRDETKLGKILLGGDQERNRRASTPNVSGIIGMARAIELCRDQMQAEADQQYKWQEQIIESILKNVEGAKLNGDPDLRLPNNIHFSFNKINGESLLMSLDMQGICASMGSACTAGSMEASHVLRAIGLDDDLAYGALRLSLGRFTTQEQVDYLIEKLPSSVKTLRI